MGQIKHSDAQAERRPSSQKASAAKIQVGSGFFSCFDLLEVCDEFF